MQDWTPRWRRLGHSKLALFVSFGIFDVGYSSKLRRKLITACPSPYQRLRSRRARRPKRRGCIPTHAIRHTEQSRVLRNASKVFRRVMGATATTVWSETRSSFESPIVVWVYCFLAGEGVSSLQPSFVLNVSEVLSLEWKHELGKANFIRDL